MNGQRHMDYFMAKAASFFSNEKTLALGVKELSSRLRRATHLAKATLPERLSGPGEKESWDRRFVDFVCNQVAFGQQPEDTHRQGTPRLDASRQKVSYMASRMRSLGVKKAGRRARTR